MCHQQRQLPAALPLHRRYLSSPVPKSVTTLPLDDGGVPDPTEAEIQQLHQLKIVIIGCGRICEAMLSGMISSGRFQPSQLTACDINQARLDAFAKQFNVHTSKTCLEPCRDADIIVLAIKPQTLESISEYLTKANNKSATLISVLAGTSLETLQRTCSMPNAVRAMPNTPAIVSEGMTIWIPSASIPAERVRAVAHLLSSFGRQLSVRNEDELDMATALSGSGPAYFLLIVEAMIDAGVHLGFSRERARTLVLQTMHGTVKLASHSDMHPAELKNNITSPGGTTATALYAAEAGRLRTVISDSVWAAYRRSLEMGQKNSCIGPDRFVQKISSNDDQHHENESGL